MCHMFYFQTYETVTAKEAKGENMNCCHRTADTLHISRSSEINSLEFVCRAVTADDMLSSLRHNVLTRLSRR